MSVWVILLHTTYGDTHIRVFSTKEAADKYRREYVGAWYCPEPVECDVEE
jgi:hypothetical protein